MFKLGIGLLLSLALALPPNWVWAADLKVGIVDGMDVMEKSAAGKAVQENIKRKSAELSRPFEQRRQDIAKMMSEFEKQASLMKEDARKRKEEEINKKLEEFRKQGADAEKQLGEYQQKELAPLLQKLQSAVTAVAQESKMDLVLDKRNSGLLYISPGLDITDKVRSRFGP
jgi:outer membrane protein